MLLIVVCVWLHKYHFSIEVATPQATMLVDLLNYMSDVEVISYNRECPSLEHKDWDGAKGRGIYIDQWHVK